MSYTENCVGSEIIRHSDDKHKQWADNSNSLEVGSFQGSLKAQQSRMTRMTFPLKSYRKKTFPLRISPRTFSPPNFLLTKLFFGVNSSNNFAIKLLKDVDLFFFNGAIPTNIKISPGEVFSVRLYLEAKKKVMKSARFFFFNYLGTCHNVQLFLLSHSSRLTWHHHSQIKLRGMRRSYK